MKKNYLLFLFVILNSFYCFSQKFIIEENRITAIYEFENRSKDNIFDSYNQWLFSNYKGCSNCYSDSNKEKGYTNLYKYENVLKNYSERMNCSDELCSIKFYYHLKFSSSNNELKIVFSLRNIQPYKTISNSKFKSDLTSYLIDFTGFKKENKIISFKEYINELYNNGIIDATTKRNYINKSTFIFDSLNECLIDEVKFLLMSLKNI